MTVCLAEVALLYEFFFYRATAYFEPVAGCQRTNQPTNQQTNKLYLLHAEVLIEE